ncbi:MAG: EamA family transporter, partial [Acidimicrobiia bacterium]
VARPWTFVGSLEPVTLWGLVALGTVAMALPITTEMVSLTMVPARVVGVIITLEPVAAAATAWWFLDEALAAVQIAGLVLIMSAVAAVTWTTSQTQTHDPVPV